MEKNSEERKREMEFSVDFEGHIKVKAKSHEEAQTIFWNWVADIMERAYYENFGVILDGPFFECSGVEEE